MHVITRKRLDDFASEHPDCRSGLAHWYRMMKKGRFRWLAELKLVFASADKVDKFTVFNICGNKVRLIAAIHYNRGKVYIRHVLTHREYDREKWKEQ